MSLNNQGRINLERSGPWIGVAGLFVLLWVAVMSSQFAGWGAVAYLIALVPGVVLVSRWARPHPKRAAWVPLGSFAVWSVITAIGFSFWGWKPDADTSSPATRVLAAQCATKFDTLRGTMDENPGQPGKRLTADWDDAEARVTALSKHAKATDCPDNLNRLTEQVDGIENLLIGAAEFNMVQALTGAQRDLKHAKATRGYDPLPDKLRRAFDDLRLHAPAANAELAPQLDAVDATDPLDTDAGTTALAALKTAAASSSEFELCRQPVSVIESYDLAQD